jgi:methyl-accepting chemotaxis protein
MTRKATGGNPRRKSEKSPTGSGASSATLDFVSSEIARLADAARNGRLDVRADLGKSEGKHRDMLQGVNRILDAVTGPLNVAAGYVDKISKGVIPNRISGTYHGGVNTIKNNRNYCTDNTNALVADAGMLATAAVEGKLATRADATRHGGDYRRIVEGVNRTLDSVIGHLNVAADYVDKISRGASLSHRS